jgi:Zn-finger protein
MLDVGCWTFLILLALASSSHGAETLSNNIAQPKFLGSQSCSASSCHGGAGDKSNQYTIWSTRDFHHARPYATLQTARSERLAEVLKISDPTQSARCTVCHAPFQTVPAERLSKEVKIAEGISCETCHGPAENWIRSHTRPDYTYADRVAAGMRDLKNLYVRANTCVACHQNIDPEIRAAGHPELIFELDGQSVTQPKHWKTENNGAQVWFVGQAVALREISWQLHQEQLRAPQNFSNPDRNMVERCFALSGLLRTATDYKGIVQLMSDDFYSFQNWADKLAREKTAITGPEQLTRECLMRLASISDKFSDVKVPKSLQVRRAERLVLAFDRLVVGLPEASTNSAVNQSLNKLFADAQSLPDFDPNQFAKDLKEFQASVSPILETK